MFLIRASGNTDKVELSVTLEERHLPLYQMAEGKSNNETVKASDKDYQEPILKLNTFKENKRSLIS